MEVKFILLGELCGYNSIYLKLNGLLKFHFQNYIVNRLVTKIKLQFILCITKIQTKF